MNSFKAYFLLIFSCFNFISSAACEQHQDALNARYAGLCKHVLDFLLGDKEELLHFSSTSQEMLLHMLDTLINTVGQVEVDREIADAKRRAERSRAHEHQYRTLQLRDLSLRWCDCIPLHERLAFALCALEDIRQKRPDLSEELTFVSIGAGDALLEYLMISALLKLGYTKILLLAIDPAQSTLSAVQIIEELLAQEAGIKANITCRAYTPDLFFNYITECVAQERFPDFFMILDALYFLDIGSQVALRNPGYNGFMLLIESPEQSSRFIKALYARPEVSHEGQIALDSRSEHDGYFDSIIAQLAKPGATRESLKECIDLVRINLEEQGARTRFAIYNQLGLPLCELLFKRNNPGSSLSAFTLDTHPHLDNALTITDLGSAQANFKENYWELFFQTYGPVMYGLGDDLPSASFKTSTALGRTALELALKLLLDLELRDRPSRWSAMSADKSVFSFA